MYSREIPAFFLRNEIDINDPPETMVNFYGRSENDVIKTGILRLECDRKHDVITLYLASSRRRNSL